MTEQARLVVLTPADLQAGFRLAGVDTRVVGSVSDVEAELDRLAAENERGVIAVYRPYYDGLEAELRRRLETSMRPVVVPLPAGLADGAAGDRRARLMERLQRAIGYHITFGEDEG